MWLSADGRINTMAFDPARTPAGKKMRKFAKKLSRTERQAVADSLFEWGESLVDEPEPADIDLVAESTFKEEFVPDSVIDDVVRQIVAANASVTEMEVIIRGVDDRWRPDVLDFLEDCFE